MKARTKKNRRSNQELRIRVSAAVIATTLMGGCATQWERFNQEFARQRQLIEQQAPETAQQNRQQTERANAELGKLIRPVPKTDITPLEMSNGLPKKDPEPPLPIMTSMGIPTGRMRVAGDGTTYYEMRSVNGAIYWTDKK